MSLPPEQPPPPPTRRNATSARPSAPRAASARGAALPTSRSRSTASSAGCACPPRTGSSPCSRRPGAGACPGIRATGSGPCSPRSSSPRSAGGLAILVTNDNGSPASTTPPSTRRVTSPSRPADHEHGFDQHRDRLPSRRLVPTLEPPPPPPPPPAGSPSGRRSERLDVVLASIPQSAGRGGRRQRGAKGPRRRPHRRRRPQLLGVLEPALGLLRRLQRGLQLRERGRPASTLRRAATRGVRPPDRPVAAPDTA